MLRDYETLLADLVTKPGHYQRLDYFGEGLLVCVFGPGLTVLLIKTKRASFSTLCCSARALEPVLRTQTRRQEALKASGPLAAPPPPRHLAGGELDDQLSGEVQRLLSQLQAASAGANPGGGGAAEMAAIRAEMASPFGGGVDHPAATDVHARAGMPPGGRGRGWSREDLGQGLLLRPPGSYV